VRPFFPQRALLGVASYSFVFRDTKKISLFPHLSSGGSLCLVLVSLIVSRPFHAGWQVAGFVAPYRHPDLKSSHYVSCSIFSPPSELKKAFLTPYRPPQLQSPFSVGCGQMDSTHFSARCYSHPPSLHSPLLRVHPDRSSALSSHSRVFFFCRLGFPPFRKHLCCLRKKLRTPMLELAFFPRLVPPPGPPWILRVETRTAFVKPACLATRFPTATGAQAPVKKQASRAPSCLGIPPPALCRNPSFN